MLRRLLSAVIALTAVQAGDNLPHATFNGRDAQLEAAIAYLQKKIAEDPRPVPKAPPYPKKVIKGIP